MLFLESSSYLLTEMPYRSLWSSILSIRDGRSDPFPSITPVRVIESEGLMTTKFETGVKHLISVVLLSIDGHPNH